MQTDAERLRDALALYRAAVDAGDRAGAARARFAHMRLVGEIRASQSTGASR